VNILFIQAGGSIDKDYPKLTKGYAFEITKPAVARIISNSRPGFSYEIIELLKKDSQDMTASDRKLIYETCKAAKQKKIVITHGTDTMLETAKALSGITNKTIVLTGSLVPEKFKGSDADFNVGSAVGALAAVPHGIYIAMHGRVITYSDAVRELKTGQFSFR
jgi:L-asparaginase